MRNAIFAKGNVIAAISIVSSSFFLVFHELFLFHRSCWFLHTCIRPLPCPTSLSLLPHPVIIELFRLEKLLRSSSPTVLSNLPWPPLNRVHMDFKSLQGLHHCPRQSFPMPDDPFDEKKMFLISSLNLLLRQFPLVLLLGRAFPANKEAGALSEIFLCLFSWLFHHYRRQSYRSHRE